MFQTKVVWSEGGHNLS